MYDVYTKVFELLGSTRNLGKSVNTAVETHYLNLHSDWMFYWSILIQIHAECDLHVMFIKSMSLKIMREFGHLPVLNVLSRSFLLVLLYLEHDQNSIDWV